MIYFTLRLNSKSISHTYLFFLTLNYVYSLLRFSMLGSHIGEISVFSLVRSQFGDKKRTPMRVETSETRGFVLSDVDKVISDVCHVR